MEELLVVGGLALLASKMFGGKKGQDQQGGGGSGGSGSGPKTQPVDNTMRDIGTGLGVAGSVVGIATTVGGAVVGALTTAGVIGAKTTAVAATTGAAGAGAAGAGGSGASAAAGGGSTAGITIGAAGPVAAIIIVWLAWVMGVIVVNLLDAFKKAAAAFVNSTLPQNAKFYFDKFRAQGVDADVLRNAPPAELRRVMLTCLFLEYWPRKWRNDLLKKFYVNAGYPPGRQPLYSNSNTQVADNFFPLFAADSLTPLAGDTYTTTFLRLFGLTESDICYVDRQHSAAYCAARITAVVSPAVTESEMRSAAASVLGPNFDPLLAQIEFSSAVSALALAGQQIWTQGQWPGDEVFTKDLQRTMLPGWQYVSPGPFMTMDGQLSSGYWLVDPRTGNRVQPAQIRRHWQIMPFVSIKGMLFSGTSGSPPGSVYTSKLLPGQTMYAGAPQFGRFSDSGQRRFAQMTRGRFSK